MQKPENIIQHELIGLHIKIIKSHNISLENLEGEIIDESKEMFTIKTKNGEKKVAKKGCEFELTLPKQKIIIRGELLEGAPEKRIKKNIPKMRA